LSLVTAIFNNLGFIKVKKWNGKSYYTIGGNIASDFWGERDYSKYLEDFIQIPELNAIINYRAWAESQVKLQVVSKKSGEPIENDFSKLLRNPNWFQSQVELWRQTVIYRMVTGQEYLFFLTPVGMKKSIKGLFTLPSDRMFIKCPVKYFFLEATMPDSIEYVFKADPYGREVYQVNPEMLLHLTENRVSYDWDKEGDLKEMRKNYLYGTSPLASVTNELKTLRLIHEGRYSLRDVPAGVFGSDSKDAAGNVPLQPNEKDDLQERLENYSMARSKFQWVISNKSLQLRSTVVDLEKLKLYDDNRKSVENICAAIGVPIEIVGGKDVTFENKKQAERGMYQNIIIPSSAERIQAINRKLGTDSESWEVIGTYHHLPIFQENEKERGQAVSTLVTALNKALQDKAIDLEDYQKELARFGIGKGKEN